MVSIFVYGTLMKNQSNHHLLDGFTPKKAILKGFKRIWPKREDFPVIERTNDNDQVVGEVYIVDERTKQRLDSLEGVPHLFYILTVTVETDKEESAIVYYPTQSLLDQWKE